MRVYADNAATTYMSETSMKVMVDCLKNANGNPNSLHSEGQAAKEVLEDARAKVAKAINAANPNEIYFTSGGSEADNQALISAARGQKVKGKNHLITMSIEHDAILNTMKKLEKEGFDVTILDPQPDGIIDIKDIENAIRPDTALVSIMFANNEIGSIQPIAEIGKMCHEKGVLFHTDAVQAFGHIPINVDDMNIDMLSASGHKLNGPKGIGVMYIRKGVKIRSFIHGGAQERQRRAGTHNVPGIVGLGKAVELAKANMAELSAYETKLRDHLIERVTSEIPYTRLNGHRTDRLPNNANFCFRFIEGESMLILLDQAGICGSSGSACTSGSLDPSHVLLAIGLPHEIAHGSLRLTLSEKTTLEDIDYTVDKLKEIIARLRSMSPLYEDFVKKNGKSEA